jgi:hypothetical protein
MLDRDRRAMVFLPVILNLIIIIWGLWCVAHVFRLTACSVYIL